jgi:2'-5' RNA ligase
VRLFTAIDLSEEVRERLRQLLARWKPLAKISWSPADSLHITTKFIGEWQQQRLNEIEDALRAIPHDGAFDLAVRGLGWFPLARASSQDAGSKDVRRPRVLWAGVEAGEALAKLARATEQAVAALGVPVEERPYSPHLTLARIREAVPLDALRRAVTKTIADFGTFRATEFLLYLSAGGKYTRLAAFPLDEKGDRPLCPRPHSHGKPEICGRGQSSLSPFST